MDVQFLVFQESCEVDFIERCPKLPWHCGKYQMLKLETRVICGEFCPDVPSCRCRELFCHSHLNFLVFVTCIQNGQRMYVATHICEKLVRIYWCRENMCQQWKDSSLVQSDYWPINKFWAQHSVLCVRKKANQTLRAKINILIFFKFLIYRTAKRILST